MNSCGNVVAIGAYLNDVEPDYVRVYQHNNGTWTQLGTDIGGEAAEDQSGIRISINDVGDIVAIGSNFAEESYAGHARIFQYDGVDWSQIGQTIIGEDDFDFSGLDVTLNGYGDIVAIGATQMMLFLAQVTSEFINMMVLILGTK